MFYIFGVEMKTGFVCDYHEEQQILGAEVAKMLIKTERWRFFKIGSQANIF